MKLLTALSELISIFLLTNIFIFLSRKLAIKIVLVYK
ncbi:UDP-N-acetylglucosamine--undecaprenyl-phosphate N-acetylglucosaminephosphotransferase, partial [Salmonella enterica]